MGKPTNSLSLNIAGLLAGMLLSLSIFGTHWLLTKPTTTSLYGEDPVSEIADLYEILHPDDAILLVYSAEARSFKGITERAYKKHSYLNRVEGQVTEVISTRAEVGHHLGKNLRALMAGVTAYGVKQCVIILQSMDDFYTPIAVHELGHCVQYVGNDGKLIRSTNRILTDEALAFVEQESLFNSIDDIEGAIEIFFSELFADYYASIKTRTLFVRGSLIPAKCEDALSYETRILKQVLDANTLRDASTTDYTKLVLTPSFAELIRGSLKAIHQRCNAA
ncbi:hypothetical protein AB4254_11710 [Vibrio breoganii]